MSLRQLLSLGALLASAVFCFAKSPSPARFTSHELAVGHRERFVVAMPKPERRARIADFEAAAGIRVHHLLERLGGMRVIELAGNETVEQAVRRLHATGEYTFVEPDYLYRPDAVPNDPSFPDQWSLSNSGQISGYTPGADVRAVNAWSIIHSAPNVIVAVIDTGVRVDHPDIAPNLWTNPNPTFGDLHGASFINGEHGSDISDEEGHGTHVAGILCAAGNNGVAISGVVWKTQLMVLKHATADGYSLSSDSAAAVDYAVAHGASVINCSWGGLGSSHTLYTALKAARDAGVIVVCSAGNDGVDNDSISHYPSNYLLDNIVTVGNSTGADKPNASSDYGNLVDLFAPGTHISSLDFAATNGLVIYSGTSMSAPHVAGALVLLRAYYGNDTFRDSINRLLNGTQPLIALAGLATTNGRLDIAKALASSNAPYNAWAQNAAIVTGENITLRGSNRFSWNTPPPATPGDPVHATGTMNSTLWWEWYAPKAGTYVVDTSGSEYDTAIDVYTGTRPTNTAASAVLTPLVSNDDDGAKKTSRVTIHAAAPGFFFICVGSPHDSYGYTQLNIALVAANDDFANATLLTGAAAQAEVSNRVATLEPNEPTILGQAGVASVWYKWTAPRTGRFQASCFSFDFDVLLAVYTGTAIDKLTLVQADDDTDPGSGIHNEDGRCTFDATAGTVYYLQVETKSDAARGTGVVTITDSAWQLSNDGGYFEVGPAVAPDGTVYLAGGFPDYHFYAVRPDGSLKWTYSNTKSIDFGSPAIGADGTVFQGTSEGTVLALNRDGTVRWTRKLGSSGLADASLALAGDGTIYAHGDDGYLYALAPTDGAVRWSFDAAVTTTGTASIAADGTIYQVSDGRKCLYAINPNGTQKWRYDSNTLAYCTPAIDAAGNIYFTSDSDSSLTSLTPAGTLRWRYSASTHANYLATSATLSGDGKTVYVGDGDGYLHAVNAGTGAVVWTYQCTSDGIYLSTPAVDANGVIYIGGMDGLLYAVNADGTLKRTWSTGLPIYSSPAISGTTLYVGSNDGKLYAFDIGAGPANGPWPQYAHDARRTSRVGGDALAILTQPSSQTVKIGSTLTLSVKASGSGLTYQWTKDGAVVNGATADTYTVSGATKSDAGSYTVTVFSHDGSALVSVTSESATITMIEPPPPAVGGRLINVSIRSQAGTDSQTLIVGASIVGGASNVKKPVLVRGVGQTLAVYGIDNGIQDPVLTLYQGPTSLLSNDGWQDDAQISAIGHQVGAFALKRGSTDAALYTELPSGSYSAQLTGKKGTGVALVELYDATAASAFDSNSPRLVNASARTQVGTGGDVLIIGFNIDGDGPERLLIRGVGAKLAAYGVAGALQDPKLELYKGTAKIDENDNWTNTPEILNASQSVNAFAIDAGSKDAVLIETLQPGGYSALVRGVGDTTGVAIVELYELK